MEIIDIINKVAKITSINVITYLVFIKLIDYKENNYKKIITIILISLSISVLGIFLTNYTEILYAMGIVYILYGTIISKITKNKLKYSIIITFIALTITNLLYIISIILTGIFTKLFIPKLQTNNPIVLLIIIIFESILLYNFFKLKRFKGGFPFLKNFEKVNNIGIGGFALIGLAMFIYSALKDNQIITYMIIGGIIEAVCMFIWIRKKITKYYKQKLKENTIQELEKEIQQKDEEIKDVLEENEKIATINHKYSSRITALEKFSAKILTKPEIISKMKEEFGEDFTEFENQIKILTSEYKSEMKESLKVQNKIQKTNIFGIDKLLEYLKEEAESNNIEFNLKLNGSINYMVENVIDQSKLETLLGDHIKDAIIAIQHSNNNYKKILVIIGIIDNYYEVCIYDTGIEFEINTLLKLGTEAITTHKQIGGSGIGFMTTFKTMNETKASLIIEENHKENNIDFTKAVRIRFDGRNEYKIKSYRAEKINNKIKDNRIIIENI